MFFDWCFLGFGGGVFFGFVCVLFLAVNFKGI